MAWTIKFAEDARKEFEKLSHPVQKTIYSYLSERISPLDNPRDFGSVLRYEKAGYWRYRVGRYRIICDIQDEQMIVMVLRVGKRDEVYRR